MNMSEARDEAIDALQKYINMIPVGRRKTRERAKKVYHDLLKVDEYYD